MAPRTRLRVIGPRVGVVDLRIKPAPKVADRFYNSGAWRDLVEAIKAQRGARCEEPGCGRVVLRIYGDHIKELRDGGAPLDPANIMLRCGSCHVKKTNRVRAERMAERFTCVPTDRH